MNEGGERKEKENDSRPRGSRRGNRPETAGGRGQRGGFGRGGKKFDNHHDNEESKHHHKNRKDGGHHRRGTAPRDAPKDSFFYKFHYGPWPTVEDIEVKLDTELPAQIPKEDRLKEPLKEEYTKNLQHLDDEVKALFDKIKEINKQKEQIYKKGVEENKEKEAAEGKRKDDGKTFKQLVEERNAQFAKKKELDAELKAMKDKFDGVSNEIRAMNKLVDPKCKTVDDVIKKIAQINNTMQTESTNPKQEKEYLKEISFLEKSKIQMGKLEKMLPIINNYRNLF